MRLHDRHRDRGFSHFREIYKPHVRPENHLRRIRKAFAIDARFEAEFSLLRPWLQRAQAGWVDRIVDILLKFDGIGAGFNEGDKERLRNLYRRHADAFASGRLDEDYLDSLEDVALFFLFHGVRSVWLAGAYGQLTEEAVDYFFDIAKNRRNAPEQRLMRCFSKAMTIELSQIQRVFICYERHLQSAVLGHLAEIGPGIESMLRDSLFTINEYAPALSEKFFDHLEERAPELGSLLPGDAEKRTALLLDALTRAVGGLAGPEGMSSVREMGRALVGAPLHAEHRSIVEEALLAALKQAFGVKWQGDLERAWTALYQKTSLMVLDARDEACRAADVRDLEMTA